MSVHPIPEPEPPALEGRIVLWEARDGLICIDAILWMDAVVAAAGDPGVGAPVGLHGRLASMPLALAVLATVDRWARRGDVVRFERRAGRDGGGRLRLSSGPTFLTLDVVPTSQAPAVAA